MAWSQVLTRLMTLVTTPVPSYGTFERSGSAGCGVCGANTTCFLGCTVTYTASTGNITVSTGNVMARSITTNGNAIGPNPLSRKKSQKGSPVPLIDSSETFGHSRIPG